MKYFRLMLAIVAIALSASANAVVVPIVAYNADAPGLDLSVDVTVDDGIASFAFSNDSTGEAADAVIARIYFETGLADLLSDPTIAGGSGVSFGEDFGGPASPPGGNLVNWGGEFYAIGALPPPAHNGIDVGDSLLVTFAYAGTVDDLVAAITDADGNSRIAVHVLDCANGQSCAAITTVPLPAGFPLLLSGFFGLFLARRRRVS